MDDLAEKKSVVETMNRAQRAAFLSHPVSDRILFVSHCIRRDKRDAVKAHAEELGYRVYIVGGGSIVRKRIVSEKPGAVVGIACFDELRMATDNIDIPYQIVLLDRDGCEDTDFDMDAARRVLGEDDEI